MAISEEVQLKVMADASAAMREMTKLTESLSGVRQKAEDAGGGFDKFLTRARDISLTVAGAFHVASKAIGLVGDAVDLVTSQLKKAQHEQQLIAKQGEAWVESMKASTRKYVDDEELVQKALGATRGELALNKEQFELAVQVSKNLAKEGEDFSEVLDATVKGMQGQTRGLKEYGISVKNTGTEQEKLNDLIRQLQDIASKNPTGNPTVDYIQEKQADLREAVDAWKDALSTLFIDITGIINSIVDKILWAAEKLGIYEKPGAGGPDVAGMMKQAKELAKTNPDAAVAVMRAISAMTGEHYKLDIGGGKEIVSFAPSFGLGLPGTGPAWFDAGSAAVMGKDQKALSNVPGGRGRGAPTGGGGGFLLNAAQRDMASEDLMAVFDEFMQKEIERLNNPAQAAGLARYVGINPYTPEGARELTMQGVELNKADRAISASQDEAVAEASMAPERRRERMLDKLKDSTNAYGAAFSTMSAGITAAVDAAITGEMALDKAIKGAVASSLKGIATQAAMKALWEGAEAIASLAVGDAKGAALHGTAAAKYVAVAAVAGIAAGAMYHNGWGDSGGGGASASTPAGGGYVGQRNNGGGGDNITVIINGDIWDENATAEKVAKAIRKRDRRLGSDNGSVVRE